MKTLFNVTKGFYLAITFLTVSNEAGNKTKLKQNKVKWPNGKQQKENRDRIENREEGGGNFYIRVIFRVTRV